MTHWGKVPFLIGSEEWASPKPCTETKEVVRKSCAMSHKTWQTLVTWSDFNGHSQSIHIHSHISFIRAAARGDRKEVDYFHSSHFYFCPSLSPGFFQENLVPGCQTRCSEFSSAEEGFSYQDFLINLQMRINQLLLNFEFHMLSKALHKLNFSKNQWKMSQNYLPPLICTGKKKNLNNSLCYFTALPLLLSPSSTEDRNCKKKNFILTIQGS